ncbi:MAG TPA: hypothetical protein PLO44_00885 [Candidatus Paceibacterota bacterium]|nr:hypothetical protein [Candidatus Paceibacterota bacterium]
MKYELLHISSGFAKAKMFDILWGENIGKGPKGHEASWRTK